MKNFWIFGIVLALMGIAFLALGIRGLIGKKPFAYPAKYNLWLIGLAFLPQFIFPFQMLLDGSTKTTGLFPLLVPFIMYPVLFAFLWKQMSGYLILGITDDSFRTALHRALQKNNIHYEETLSHMRLPELGADLQASVQSWMGVAQLRVKQPEHQDTLKRIMSTLNEEFSAPTTQINMTTCAFYVIMGAMILVMAVFFTFTTGRLAR